MIINGSSWNILAREMAGKGQRFCIRFLWFGLGLIINLLPVRHVECLCSAKESKALLDLKQDNLSSALSSWKHGSDCCSGWAGVTCDISGTHVIALNLTGHLSISGGDISESLCNLFELQVLNMSIAGPMDSLYWVVEGGGVPDCIWNMTHMRSLTITKLGITTLQGFISAQVCTLRHLVHLDISGLLDIRGLTWSHRFVPDCIWEMTKLEYLDLGMAWVSESFSSEVCNLKNLIHLRVGGITDACSNQGGYIPACISNLAKLEYLSLPGLNQHSSIPVDLCNLVNLKHLDLHGEIPTCVWNMTKLEHLDLNPCAYPSTIPSTVALGYSLSSDLCNLKNLSYLRLHSVSFARGYIPACLWNLTGLETLDIGDMDLPGSFSYEMCNLQKLQVLDISHNDFSGELPACIWNATLLERLDLSELDLRKMETPKRLSAPSLKWLSLGSTSVSEAFLEAIGNLSALQRLNVSGNSITTLSDGIQYLYQLNALDVSENFIALIPPWIGRLQNLRSLWFPGNRIETLTSPSAYCHEKDDIQSGLSNLTELESLFLSSNRIVNVPLSLFNLSQLYRLELSDNLLEDFLLPINDLPNLVLLYLSSNPLQGIPNGLSYLQQLAVLSLSNISLSTSNMGDMSCLKNLSSLTDLSLSSNNISGDFTELISSTIHNATQLSYLDLSNNNISGNLSFVPRVLTELYYLDLSRNQLTGELSIFLHSGSLRYVLLYLNVSSNQLTGPISEKHGQTDFPLSLKVLDLSFNSFSGTIPSFLGEMQNLQVLDLTSNRFQGSLPENLGDCRELQHLRLSKNFLCGVIPRSIGKLGKSLLSITISINFLEGPIPSSLGKCVGLYLLDLSHNKLNGSLPSTLENLSNSLRIFTVAYNNLHGSFPAWIVSGNFSSLHFLDISNNHFHGILPAAYSKLSGFINGTNANNNDTIYGDGIQVSLNGYILEIKYFVTARTFLDVSSNQFSGHIPEKLGELRSLRYLNVSSNSFVHNIPVELSNLHDLESLDLSKNSLTGGIPSELSRIPQLSDFNVSNNFLTGPIPTGGQFNTFSEDSFRNNPGLCSVSGIPLRSCQHPTPKSPTAAPQSMQHGYPWRKVVSQWISLEAFIAGFGPSFGVVALTFVVSKSARVFLFVPRRKRFFGYSEPYGAYVPRS